MGTIFGAAPLRTPTVFPGSLQRREIIGAAPLRSARPFPGRFVGPTPIVPSITTAVSRLPYPSTMLGALADGVSRRSCQDRLCEAGQGSFQLEYDDDTSPMVLDGRDLITFFYKGEAVHTMVVKELDTAAVAPDEEAGQHTVFSGPGHLGEIARALIWPTRGLLSQPIEEDRGFNWTSPSYDRSTWRTPFQVCTLADARRNAAFLWSLGDPTAPQADPAYWAQGFDILGTLPLMWDYGATINRARPLPAEAGGTCYFAQEIDIPSTGIYDIYFTATATGSLYVDGQLVVSTNEIAQYLNSTKVTLTLSAGGHTIAWSCTAALDALAIWGTGFNAGFSAFDIYSPGGFFGSPLPICRTDSTAKFVPYAPSPPGMTVGQAMLIALDEAQFRGKIPWVEPMFDEVFDSNGVAWPRVADIATKVSTDLYTFFRELCTTYIDMWMAPASGRFYAWNLGGRNRTTLDNATTEFDQGLDIGQLDIRTEMPIAEGLLIKSALGWTFSGAGDTEASLQLGALSSESEIARVSAAERSKVAVVRNQFTLSQIVGPDAADAWIGYLPGDYAFIEADFGLAPVPENEMRVIGITMTEDQDGEVGIAPELGDPIATTEEKTNTILKKLSDGSVGGRAQTAQRPVPTFTPQATIGFDGLHKGAGGCT